MNTGGGETEDLQSWISASATIREIVDKLQVSGPQNSHL